MHGGLFSRDDVTLQEIREIDRNRQPPDEGLMCELLWSDPQPQMGRAPSKRGVGVQFGPDVTQNFLSINSLDYIVRSHEVKNDGYEVGHDGKCITVFSAPNYWYVHHIQQLHINILYLCLQYNFMYLIFDYSNGSFKPEVKIFGRLYNIYDWYYEVLNCR